MDKYKNDLQAAYEEAKREIEERKELIEAQAENLRKVLVKEGEPNVDICLCDETKKFFIAPRSIFADEDMNYVVLTAEGKKNGFSYVVEIFGNEDKDAIGGYAFEPFLLRNKGDIWEYLVEGNWEDCQFDEEDDLDAYIDFGGNHEAEDEYDDDEFGDDEDEYDDDEYEDEYEDQDEEIDEDLDEVDYKDE